jgi:uncharacterized protein (DUF302 family)
VVAAIALLWTGQALASGAGVMNWEVGKDLDTAYPVIYQALEDNRFYVVFEPDIQKNLAGFAERWGEDYNRNALEGIRAMVFCNGWYANQVSNADPGMMALCPLHITLIQQAGKTRVLFVRPTHVAAGSDAEAIAGELEQAVADAIEVAVNKLTE